jgi:hypothetical protein
MKPFVLCLAASITASSVFCQGRIAFNNDPPATGPNQAVVGSPDAPGEGSVGAYLGTHYTASLFYLAGDGFTQASFDASNPVWLADASFGVGTFGSIPPAGLFDGGFPTLPFTGVVTVEIRAWYNVGATSYEDAMAQGFNVGESGVTSGDAYASPASPFFLDGIGNIVVSSVPEPSILNILGVGTAITLAALVRPRAPKVRSIFSPI